MVVRPTAAPIWAGGFTPRGGTTNGTGQKQGENIMAAPFEGHCHPLAQDN
jgi:hypothetical protein